MAVKFHGIGVVWDKEKDKALIRFDASGEFETDDTEIIDKLASLGFKSTGEPPKKSKSKKKEPTE